MEKQIKLLSVCLFLCLTSLVQPLFAQETGKKIKVACIGNSITFGAGIPNRDKDSYPAVLGQMLGNNYTVRNFGVNARTMLNKGDHPYMNEPAFQEALAFQPNIVTIKLGTNDTKPQNWKYNKEFKKDLMKMIKSFQNLPSRPKIYLCYPAKAYISEWGGINDSIITQSVIPYIQEVSQKMQTEIIDLHTSTSGMKADFPDNIHPNEKGATVLAKTIYKALTGKESEHTMQAFPGLKSKWNGYDRYDFRFNDREAIVITPQKALKGNPWIWRPAFFDAFPSVDKALVEKGFHVAYYDLTHLYGSPRSLELGTNFYNTMTQVYGLSPKVTLEGFSRGGLFAFNWAAKNTDKVACIYVDAPVCDLFSWPGRKNASLWNDLLEEWNLTDEQMNDFKGNPIDKLAPIAQAGIPIISVCGDSDQVVPFKNNMDVIRSRYLSLGGNVEVIIKPGCDHHPHSLDNPEPVVNFILRNQPEYQTNQHFTARGSLQNSFLLFEKERKGRVAFLGGSITEMNGWKDRIEKELKQRFPYTVFEFVEAGIGSTGTTPGAFRLENDVLSQGKIDLLFVEAAVNDDTNGFSAREQVRGMEGEVRHALQSNPNMDIVMLHFIYDPFIPLFAKGQMPDVILNHERVANHYLIPSINLAQEIAERMQDGQLTWEQFGGTHPLPFGHTFYAATINRLFDTMWKNIPLTASVQAHAIPELPLDAFSYTNGRFIPINQAKINKGWKVIPSWNPSDNAEKRGGFVNVPMLEGSNPGDQLTLAFNGKAIGVFCVPGPTAGILEYSVDNAPFKKLDTFTEWSQHLYIPWLYMLETELSDTNHTLRLRISSKKNEKSIGTQCQIRNFVVNE